MRDLQGEAEGLVQISWSLDIINYHMEPPCHWDHLVRGSSLRVVQVDSRAMILAHLQNAMERQAAECCLVTIPHPHPPPHHTYGFPDSRHSPMTLCQIISLHHSKASSAPPFCFSSETLQTADPESCIPGRATELFLLGFQTYQKTNVTDFLDSEKNRLRSQIFKLL